MTAPLPLPPPIPLPLPCDDSGHSGFGPGDVDAFINAAWRQFDALPLAQRAAFDCIAATLLDPFDPDAARLARATAAFLREADTHQAKLFESVVCGIQRQPNKPQQEATR